MALPIQKKTETYNNIPFRIRFLIGFVVVLLNKISVLLEPYNMAPYFCINSYEDYEEEEPSEELRH